MLLVLLVACNRSTPAALQSGYSDAYLKLEQGYLDSAFRVAERGVRASANNPVWNWKFRLLEAEIEIRNREAQKSLDLLDSLPVAPSADLQAKRSILQGVTLCWLNQISQGEARLREAELLLTSITNDLQAELNFNKGICALLHNDHSRADHYLQAALSRVPPKDDLFRAYVLVNLGVLAMSIESYDEALDWFNRSLSLARPWGAYPFEQKALGNIGWSYFQIGDFENAATALTRAAEIAAQVHDLKNRELWLRDLGILFYVQGNYAKAETYYQQSMALAQRLRGGGTIAINYHNLAQLELKRGSLDKAEDYNRKAYAAKGLSPGDTTNPYLLLTSGEIALERKDFSTSEQYLKAVIHAPNADSSLRWQAQSDLANLYVAQNMNNKAEEMFIEALHTVQTAREGVQQEDRRMSILDAWPFYDDYIRFLVNQGKDEKALQIAEFSRGRTLAEAFGIGGLENAAGLQVRDIKTFLRRQNRTILAYWLSAGESYLWVIGPATFKLFRLPGKENIDHAIDRYNNEIRGNENTENSARGRALYEMLVQPAQALLPPHAQVIVVPNRGLYKLNFESLVVPGKTPHYWIDDAVIESASSIALLVKAKHRPANGLKKLLLMGAPVEETADFHSLRFASEEIESVAHHFPRNQETILAGKAATPSAYSVAKPGAYQFIHLVTHGTASQTSPLDSAIILSSDPDKSFKLYARNIKDIRPLHAELVTISACYGAGEKAYSGEGLVGLAWAFMRAGSHQVVAALWEVGDATMAKIMDRFYEEIERGKSVPESLRLAKLSILHSQDFHKKPYYWASLQIYTGS